MPNTQSKLSVYKLVPAKYVNRISLELQRTFLVTLSLLKTHRRKAILLSLGPATILKFITVMLPIIKLMPTLIKALQSLSYFTKGNSSSTNNHQNLTNSHSNHHNNPGTITEGLGMSMDELSEILWTPAEDMYWERVNAMVTRFGLCKTLGISLAGVRPGKVEVVMPFRAEVSGEGGAFHASLVPTLIALTSQLTGMTLLPTHFTLKPIDFKCNILSDCDSSTYLLLSRGAVVVRGDHSITVKVEILKASSQASAPATFTESPSILSWRSWVGSSSSSPSPSSSSSNMTPPMVPGTGIERSKFVVCASGMQTSVVVRAGTDPNGEEEKEMARLKKKRQQQRKLDRSSSSSSYSSSSSIHGQDESNEGEDAIILGDSFQFLPASPSSPASTSPVATTPTLHIPTTSATPSASRVQEDAVHASKTLESNSTRTMTATTSPSTTAPIFSYASAVSHGTSVPQEHHYDLASDTEAWQK